MDTAACFTVRCAWERCPWRTEWPDAMEARLAAIQHISTCSASSARSAAPAPAKREHAEETKEDLAMPHLEQAPLAAAAATAAATQPRPLLPSSSVTAAGERSEAEGTAASVKGEPQDDSDSDVEITGTKQAHTTSRRRSLKQEPRVDKPAAAAVAPFTAAASEDGPSAAAAKKRKPSRSREEAPAEATAAAAAAAVPVAAASVDSASASSAKRRKGSMSDRVRAVAANQMGAAADGAAAAGPAVVDSIPSQLTAEDRAAITPELISQRNRDCGRWFSNPFLSRKLRAKPLEGTPFLPALSNRSPPTKHLSRMHFAGRDFDVRVLDGHLCVNFTELLIALLETDLFQPLPPGGESFVPPSLAANPRADMEWLYWYTYFLWPPGRYGADVWLTRAPWGIVVVENTCMLQVPAGHPPETGTPWITVHLLHMLSELYHLKLDDTDTRPLLKARDELRQAYTPLLQWEREAGRLRGRPEDAVHVCQSLGKAYTRKKQEKVQRAV